MRWNLRENTRLLIVVCSGTSAAVGASVGFVAASKYLEKKYQSQLAKDVDDARSYFQQMYSTPTFVADEPVQEEAHLLEEVQGATDEIDGMPRDLVGDALAKVRVYQAETPENASEPGDDRTPAPVIVNNIFQNVVPPSNDVLDALMSDRDPNFPYIITKEEFYENDPDHEQKKFTYWEADEILVDDQEELQPIEDIERIAGEENLLRFGYGSRDEHVLYIRNETLEPPLDLHITRSTGKYSVEVMALDDGEPHLQHSQPRKFRFRDE